jgi:hypothetical protein
MKKNKSKKLKKQFKKLLHEHINRAIEEKGAVQRVDSTKKIEEIASKKPSSDKNTSDKFAKKDIAKTAIIASVLIISIILTGYYLNKNNLFSEAIELLTNLFK